MEKGGGNGEIMERSGKMGTEMGEKREFLGKLGKKWGKRDRNGKMGAEMGEKREVLGKFEIRGE